MPEARTVLAARAAASGSDHAAAAPRAAPAPAYRSDLDEAGLVRCYAPTVKRLALHLKGRLPRSVELDDLVQAGLIAILRLARRPAGLDIGAALLRRSLLNAMIDEARRASWAPTRTVRLAKVVAGAMQAVRRRLGREGSDGEIAGELGLTIERYDEVLIELAGLSLLDLDAFDDACEWALQTVPEQEETLRRRRMTAALAAAVGVLPLREQQVVSLYYEHELSMEEVGEVLGLDTSTVSRSHARALLWLRNALAEWSGPGGEARQRAGG
jgi:RNA polymerase sigma factor for flagellar operon FliA